MKKSFNVPIINGISYWQPFLVVSACCFYGKLYLSLETALFYWRLARTAGIKERIIGRLMTYGIRPRRSALSNTSNIIECDRG